VRGLIGAALCLAAGALATAKAPEWTVVNTPHFTVLTSGAVSAAQTWAEELERFRLGLGRIMPANAARLRPVVVVVFPTDKAFRPYKILQNGKPAAIGGYFSRSDSVNAISLAQDSDPKETRRIIFHEATHWFLSTRDEPLPEWLEEGIAEVFSTFAADEKQFTVGDAIGGHVRYLRAEGLPPLRQLLGTSRGKMNYNDLDRTGQFYAGSWLFAHWVTFGAKAPGEASLARYLELMKSSRDPEAAFAGAFGGDYAAVDRLVLRYLLDGRYVRRRFALPAEPLAIAAPRPATEGEVEYALGALLLGARGPAAGLPRLRRAAELDAGNPRGWEVLGFAQLRLNDHGAALAAFDHATAAGSRLALVWSNRAALRQETEHAPGDLMRTTDESEFLRDAEDYRRAIELDPRCLHAYQGLAGVVYGLEPRDARDLARLEQGVRLFPTDVWVAMGRAVARLRSDAPAEGEAELRRLLAETSGLPATVRRLGESALEGERLKVLYAHIGRLNGQRRFAELVGELDAALADGTISTQNRSSLRAIRRETDQMRRLDDAVKALNSGRSDEAAALLRAVLAEPPATWIIRKEAQRLLQAAAVASGERSR
jgi:tetratricopeptide (TPR) repeat protein